MTKTWLKVRAELDKNIYPKGRQATGAQMPTINLRRDLFHGE